MKERAEELWQRGRQVLREEDEEEREMEEHYLRLEYMSEDCLKCDQGIRGLIEEQEALLNILGMPKREFANDWEKRMHFEWRRCEK